MVTPLSPAETWGRVMAAKKPSSKAKSAGRKSTAAPKAPPFHAVGKKRRGKAAAAVHLRQAVSRNITERKRTEEALRHRAHDRGERVKEYRFAGPEQNGLTAQDRPTGVVGGTTKGQSWHRRVTPGHGPR